MKHLLRCSVPLLVVAFLPGQDPERAKPVGDRAPRHLLRLAPAEGQKSYYRMDTVQSMKIDDQAKLQHTSFGVLVERRCEPAEEGRYKVTETVLRLRRSDALSRDFDSDREDESTLGEVARIVGGKMEFLLDARGRRTKREFSEGLREMNEKSAVDFMDAGTMFLDPIELPDGPARVGDEWRAKASKDDIVTRSRYRLMSVEDGIAKIWVELDMRYVDPPKEKRDHGRKMRGTFELDMKSGRLVSANLEDRVKTVMSPMNLKLDNTVRRRWVLVPEQPKGAPWPKWEPQPLPAAKGR